ncbi:MAG: DUF1192 domain-containing protein [Hyphomicrobiaceae bacterium]
MDWDEARPRPKAEIRIGEDLSMLSIGDLEERVATLSAEIERIQATIATKRRQQDAAASLFKR